MKQDTFWHVTLRTVINNFIWEGCFTFVPTPRDLCDILGHELSEHALQNSYSLRMDVLYEVAGYIPDDYVEKIDKGEYSIRVALVKIGTLSLCEKKVYTK